MECLTKAGLLRFFEDRLNADDCREIAAHLDDCRACRLMADELSDAPELRAGDGTQINRDTSAADRHADSVAASTATRQLGRFHMREVLGSGGFGIVYLAFDTTLKRHVAIKLPRHSAFIDRDVLSRFLREAEIAANLRHPNIVPVFEAGEIDGACYLASAYCSGPTLSKWLRDNSDDIEVRVAVNIVERLADGVAHAHEFGVMHRDIKPANVLLDPERTSGELAFVPMLTDFGLAKLIEQDGEATISAAVSGTPRYMAPEQAAGQNDQVGRHTDVYALGAILYELLARCPAVAGENIAATLLNVLNQEPTPLRRLRSDIPADLEAICLKCLEKDYSRRYASAAELRNDLRRCLAGEPVTARPVTRMERIFRWARREPVIASLASLCLVAAAALVIMLLIHNRRLDDALRETAAAHRLARSSEETTRDLLYAANMRLAFDAWQRTDPVALNEHLERCRPGPAERDRRCFAWRLLKNLARHGFSRDVRRWKAHKGPVYNAALSPDRRHLATCGADSIVRVWDIAEQRNLLNLEGHEGEVNAVCFSPDGRIIASASDDHTVRLWNAEDGSCTRTLKDHQGAVYAVCFSADGRRFATAGRDGKIRVWTEFDSPPKIIDLGDRVIDDMAFGNRRDFLAVAVGTRIQIWDVDRSQRTNVLISRASQACPITSVTVSADDRFLACAGHGPHVFLWNLESGKLVRILTGHQNWVHGVAFSPDGQSIASCSKDGSVRIWPLLNYRPSDLLSEVKNARTFLATHQNGVIATVSQRGQLERWNSQGVRISSTTAKSDEPVRVALSNSGEFMLCVPTEGTEVTIVRTAAQEPLSLLSSPTRFTALAVSPDDSCFAAAADDGVSLYPTTETSDPLRTLRHSSTVERIVFAAYADVLATLDAEATIRIWNWRNGELQAVIHHVRTVSALAFADRDVVLTGDDNGDLRAWNSSTGEALASWSGHLDAVLGIAVHPNRPIFATVSADQTVQLWNRRRWVAYQTLARKQPSAQVAFSANGDALHVLDDQGRMVSWTSFNTASPAAVVAHEERAWSVQFQNDNTLATTGHNGDILITPLGETNAAVTPVIESRHVGELSFTQGGRHLAMVSGIAGLSVWNTATGTEQFSRMQDTRLLSVAAATRKFAAGSSDGRIFLWNAGPQAPPDVITAHDGNVRAVAFSPDERSVGSVGKDGHAKVWDIASRQLLNSFSLTDSKSLAFSPDGHWLAMDNFDQILLVSRDDDQVRRRLTGTSGGCEDMVFSNDSRLLVTGHPGQLVCLWDIPSGELLHELSGHTSTITAAKISADNAVVATGAFDGTLRLWSVATGQQLGVLHHEPGGKIVSLDFSGDGRLLAAAIDDSQGVGRVLLWRCNHTADVSDAPASVIRQTLALQ